MAKLDRKDTVLMDEVISRSSSEIVDFAYRVSHLWSQRHGEKADDVINQDILFYGRSKEPMKGKDELRKWLKAVHDSVEDFHYNVSSVYHEGDLKNGKLYVEFVVSGESSKQFSEFKMSLAKSFKLYGFAHYHVVDNKVVEGRTFSDVARSSPEIIQMLTSIH